MVLRTDLLLTGLFLVGVYMQVKLNSHWYVTIPNSNGLKPAALTRKPPVPFALPPQLRGGDFFLKMFLWIQWEAKSLPGFVYIGEFRFGSPADHGVSFRVVTSQHFGSFSIPIDVAFGDFDWVTRCDETMWSFYLWEVIQDLLVSWRWIISWTAGRSINLGCSVRVWRLWST